MGGGSDTIYGHGGDESLTGSNTCVLSRASGYSAIYDNNSGSNTLRLGDGITCNDLVPYAQGGSGGHLQFAISGTGASADFLSNFGPYPLDSKNILKTLDLNGASQIDVGQTTLVTAGTGSNVYGCSGNSHNLIFVWGNGSTVNATNGQYSTNESIVIELLPVPWTPR